MRLDVLARLPLTLTWFPDLNRDGAQAIAVAPALLQAELARFATNLVRRRRELVQLRGP